MTEENKKRLHDLVAERDDDDALVILEVIHSEEDEASYKNKYDELDASWRKRYREAFETPVEKIDSLGEELNEAEEIAENITLDDIFK